MAANMIRVRVKPQTASKSVRVTTTIKTGNTTRTITKTVRAK